MDAGRNADESIADPELRENLRRALIERDDPLRSALQNGWLIAGSLHGDRIGLFQGAERLGSLAAARSGQGGEKKSAGDEPGEAHDRHYSTRMRFFSEEEANDALGLVAPLVERLVAARGRFVAEGQRLADLRHKVAGNGGGLDASRVQEAQEAAEEVANEIGLLVAELETVGVQVKDLDRGLVDFPARHPESGDLVLLCWHLGEDRVAFWHGLEEGFAGRKPLPF
jgi:hypothetical protein